MIRVIKHIIVEPTADQMARLGRIQAIVVATFPGATTDIVPGLLDDDLVVEVRLPLDNLNDWRAAREAWGDFSRLAAPLPGPTDPESDEA
ncbi:MULTISPECIES: hypothetical protein [unclassified Methylobacterium]|uniref:hypothetical protein n=1 Tax=unclassified Methylobacterium TaxID=2615210 RepID=UPI0007006163|nr:MULTISPECIES: hypothetical protein [unclassified Methylobacterium]KQP92367.1 hypothetical protein ASF60_16935 [Methylobacterium sp. Leaf113]KQP96022.1 hypothetical protein ASF57_20035 [Methylobacterium sp. Leaf117]MCK2055107.1 hypothetical protein [Methylobacterium sp. 37f]